MSSLPDPARCRTRHAFGSYYACLVEKPQFCPHVLGFGGIYICKHPQNETFNCSCVRHDFLAAIDSHAGS